MRGCLYRGLAVLLAIILNIAPAQAENASLTIFYTTDTHGRVATDDKTIGLDLVAGIVRQTPHAVLVDAGDFLMGAPLAAMTKGKDVIRLMKQAGYFAAAVGNHEFDYGPEVLQQRKAEAEAGPHPMHMLSANARGRNGELLFSPEARTTLDGVQLCFFGLTTQTASMSVTPRHIAGITFDDSNETARSTAAALRASGCEIIVLLSHVGSRGRSYGSSRDLVHLPDIDAVIDGHDHVPLDEVSANGVPLVSSGAHGTHLGRLEIGYDKSAKKSTGMRNTLISRQEAGNFPPDEALRNSLAELTARQDKTLAVRVGSVVADLEGLKREIRSAESPLGNLFADALRAAYNSDFALINSGGLRAGLAKGPVTMRDILSILPFRDYGVTVRLTGRELLQVLEYGFSHLPEPSGAFPQISGLVVRVAPRNVPGERIVSAGLENGDPLLPDKEYTLATNDYVAKGGDGYPILPGKKLLRANQSMQEAAVSFFRNHDTGVYKPGFATRIIFVGQP